MLCILKEFVFTGLWRKRVFIVNCKWELLCSRSSFDSIMFIGLTIKCFLVICPSLLPTFLCLFQDIGPLPSQYSQSFSLPPPSKTPSMEAGRQSWKLEHLTWHRPPWQPSWNPIVIGFTERFQRGQREGSLRCQGKSSLFPCLCFVTTLSHFYTVVLGLSSCPRDQMAHKLDRVILWPLRYALRSSHWCIPYPYLLFQVVFDCLSLFLSW